MITNQSKLDNPAWYALQETHRKLALYWSDSAFYRPEICAFGAARKATLAQEGLTAYAQLENPFFFIGEKPSLPPNVCLMEEILCLQMLLESPIVGDKPTNCILLSQPEQHRAVYDLIQQHQPGYFKQKTTQLGSYFGCFQQGQLIASAGERMKLKGFTELSAIVTHPDYRRQGFSKQLIHHTTDTVFAANSIPFLHVVHTNKTAINLYRTLGFRTRRKISFWKLVPQQTIPF
ncbi:MAG: GNAT family N-acetyltransferase [Flavobacteriaceae bacterium]